MHKTRIYISLITAWLSISAAISAQPRLTIAIVVDGMTQENSSIIQNWINNCHQGWCGSGLQTLSETTAPMIVKFPHQVYGGQETMATLMTGTFPAQHGIMADYYYDRKERTAKAILQDPNVQGIGTHNKLSPRSLLSTTITDEWRIRYGEEAKIYAIGLNPQATILMAGHAANACCWLDKDEQKWVTTSFYSEGFPDAADRMNVRGDIKKIAKDNWKQRMDISIYNYSTKQEKKRGFNYAIKDHLLQSPSANTLVIRLALSLQKIHHLADDDTPDLLLLHLNTLSPGAKSDAIQSAEQEDIYMSLNQDLGILMKNLDKRVGKDNYQIILMGRPVKGYSKETYEMVNIPLQRFSVDRAAALTSIYLMAIYGKERWVDGGYGPFIYLNRECIEKKGLSLEMIQRQVANFLMEFEGVQVAYPINEAILSDEKQSIFRKNAGDVYFRLLDNWALDINEYQSFDNVVQQQPEIPLYYWSATKKFFPKGKLQATDIKTLILNY